VPDFLDPSFQFAGLVYSRAVFGIVALTRLNFELELIGIVLFLSTVV
jgi:hypothetical protein